MHPEEAEERLGVIRDILVRTRRYAGIPAAACFIAGFLALGGWAWCRFRGVSFCDPGYSSKLAKAWGIVCAVGLIQFVVSTILACRRRGEAAWSKLTRRVIVAMLPGIYVGAALTEFARQTGNLDYLPPFWCLCYGAALMGLGLYAGWKANLAGILFLLAGTLGLHVFKDQGVHLMGASFGGIHILLGTLLLMGHDDRTHRED